MEVYGALQRCASLVYGHVRERTELIKTLVKERNNPLISITFSWLSIDESFYHSFFLLIKTKFSCKVCYECIKNQEKCRLYKLFRNNTEDRYEVGLILEWRMIESHTAQIQDCFTHLKEQGFKEAKIDLQVWKKSIAMDTKN